MMVLHAGLMFFTEWGSAPPRLERALLDGSERRTLVSTKIVYPYGVAVDLPNRSVDTFEGGASTANWVYYNSNLIFCYQCFIPTWTYRTLGNLSFGNPTMPFSS